MGEIFGSRILDVRHGVGPVPFSETSTTKVWEGVGPTFEGCLPDDPDIFQDQTAKREEKEEEDNVETEIVVVDEEAVVDDADAAESSSTLTQEQRRCTAAVRVALEDLLETEPKLFVKLVKKRSVPSSRSTSPVTVATSTVDNSSIVVSDMS